MAQSTFPKPVDQEIKDLNSKIDTYQINSTSDTLENVQSALVTFGDTLGENEIRKIRFNISTANGVFSNQGYMGTIKKYGSGARYIVEVQNCSNAGTGQIITGVYYDGNWSWASLDNDLETYNFGTVTVAQFETALTTLGASLGNGNVKNIVVTISAESGVFDALIYCGRLQRISTGRYLVSLQVRAYEGQVITGYYSGSVWAWGSTINQIGRQYNGFSCQYVGDVSSSDASGVNVHFESLQYGFVALGHTSSARCGLYLVFGRSGDNASVLIPIYNGTSITAEAGTNGNINFKSASSSSTRIYKIVFGMN